MSRPPLRPSPRRLAGVTPASKSVLRYGVALTLSVLGLILGAAPRVTPEVAALTPAAPLATGSSPVGIAIDPLTGRIYVTNSGSNTLSVIDPTANLVVASVRTGAGPNQVVLNPKTSRLYVSNFDDHSLTVIDATTNAVVRTLTVGGLGIALDATTQRLYAAAGRALSIIDASTVDSWIWYQEIFEQIDRKPAEVLS